MSLYIFASLFPKPEYADKLLLELNRLVAASRQEPGNRRYDLFREVDGRPGFHVYEIYDDQLAYEAHQASEHYHAFREKIGGWLSEAPVVKVLEAIDAV